MDAMTLSPFGCRAEIWRESPEAEVEPLFFFLTKEGTFLTMGQTTARLSSYWYHEERHWLLPLPLPAGPGPVPAGGRGL